MERWVSDERQDADKPWSESFIFTAFQTVDTYVQRRATGAPHPIASLHGDVPRSLDLFLHWLEREVPRLGQLLSLLETPASAQAPLRPWLRSVLPEAYRIRDARAVVRIWIGPDGKLAFSGEEHDALQVDLTLRLLSSGDERRLEVSSWPPGFLVEGPRFACFWKALSKRRAALVDCMPEAERDDFR